MLDQELKQAYKKIVPSSALEKRILDMAPAVKSPRIKVSVLRHVAAIAACMVLLLGGVVWMHQAPMEIQLPDGTVLSEDAFPLEPQYFRAATARSVSEPSVASYALNEDAVDHIAIPLSFSVSGSLSISVDSGILMISYDGDNTEEYVEVGQEAAELGGNTSLYWILPLTDEGAVYDMTVNRKHTVRVTYYAEQQKYTISHMSGKS